MRLNEKIHIESNYPSFPLYEKDINDSTFETVLNMFISYHLKFIIRNKERMKRGRKLIYRSFKFPPQRCFLIVQMKKVIMTIIQPLLTRT